MNAADLLHDAAEAIRGEAPYGTPDLNAFMFAVADWLDDEAGEIPPGTTETKWGPIDSAPAVRVARAYLKED